MKFTVDKKRALIDKKRMEFRLEQELQHQWSLMAIGIGAIFMIVILLWKTNF